MNDSLLPSFHACYMSKLHLNTTLCNGFPEILFLFKLPAWKLTLGSHNLARFSSPDTLAAVTKASWACYTLTRLCATSLPSTPVITTLIWRRWGFTGIAEGQIYPPDLSFMMMMMWETEQTCSWIAQGHNIFQMGFQEAIWSTMAIKTPECHHKKAFLFFSEGACFKQSACKFSAWSLICEQNIAVLSPCASHLYGSTRRVGGGGN